MASIFTGLAFMHGHIVDRELVLRLGRDEARTGKGQGRDVRRQPPVEAVRDHRIEPACAVGC